MPSACFQHLLRLTHPYWHSLMGLTSVLRYFPKQPSHFSKGPPPRSWQHSSSDKENQWHTAHGQCQNQRVPHLHTCKSTSHQKSQTINSFLIIIWSTGHQTFPLPVKRVLLNINAQEQNSWKMLKSLCSRIFSLGTSSQIVTQRLIISYESLVLA